MNMQELIESRERAMALRNRLDAGDKIALAQSVAAKREMDVRVAEIAAHYLGH